MITVISRGPEETRQLAKTLGRFLTEGTVVALMGDLGAGKTVFAQGLAQGLGVTRQVNSPTFVILKQYRGRLPLYHVDAYRLPNAQAAEDIGLEEYLEGDGVAVVEWPENIAPLLPEERLEISLEADPGLPQERRVQIRAVGPKYQFILEEMKRAGLGN